MIAQSEIPKKMGLHNGWKFLRSEILKAHFQTTGTRNQSGRYTENLGCMH